MNKKEQTRTKYYIKKNPYKETYTNSDLYDFETSKELMYADNIVASTKIPTSIVITEEVFKDGKWEIIKDEIKSISLSKSKEQKEFVADYEIPIFAKIKLEEGFDSFLKSYAEISFEEAQSIINFYKSAFSYSSPMKKRQLDAIIEIDAENVSRAEVINELQERLDKAREDLEIHLQIQKVLQQHIIQSNLEK